MRFATILSLTLALAVSAAAKEGEGAPQAEANEDGSALADPQAEIITKYGREVRKVGQRITENPALLENPEDLLNLTSSLVPDPKFQKAFTEFVLKQYGRQPGGTTSPVVDPSARPTPVPGQPVPVPKPGFDERYLREIQRRDPGATWTYEETGRRAFAREDYRASFNDYGQALERGDTRPEIYFGYGVSAYELRDFALAQQAAKIVLSADPKDINALTLYHASKNRAPTVNLPSVLGGGGAGFDAGAIPDLGAPAAAAAAPAPGAWRGPSKSAEQYVAEARAQAAAAGPSAVARSNMITKDAASALHQRDYETAHRLATQAVQLNLANAQALNYRAMASNRLSRYSDAVVDASAALALAPGNSALLQTRSWAFAKQGLLQEALRDAEDGVAAQPDNPSAYRTKAMVLAGLKDRAGTLDALKRSAELDPRFRNLYERALQVPTNEDMQFLFDDAPSAAAAAAPPPAPRGRRFARLALLSAMGGILIALAILHVVSAGWREKVNMTIRRVLASSDAQGSEAAPQLPASPGGAFWLQYQLVKEIGLGGMGVVYEALDRSLERRVAVKKMRDEIRADPQERRRFVNEARLVARLRHPNIVDIYAIVEEGDEVYLVFEFVSGRTLSDTLKADGPMSPEAARGVLAAAASAVEHAHEAEIVHRDLKPSNIMITDDGRVKVMDFGVARQAKDALTKMSQTNSVAGTPPYMAPEQEQGTVRKESDVFALGVCLYETLTGQLPFTGGGAAMLLNKLNGKHIPPSQRNPALPPGLDAVLAKALAPDPDKRYRTPGELVRAVDAAVRAQA